MARGCGDRGHGDVANADGNAVTGLGALYINRLGDFVTATQARRDHRPPAARCRIGNDCAAIFDGAEHRRLWVQNAVGEALHDNTTAGMLAHR